MSAQHVLEVSASAKASEVVAAVIAGAQPAKQLSNHANKSMQLVFSLIVMFAIVLFFREELWAWSNDVSKHPILAYTEQLQLQHYLGQGWLFGTGKDITVESVTTALAGEQSTPTPFNNTA